jgi:hypothetical protein
MNQTNHLVDNWKKSSFSGGGGGNCVELGSTKAVIAFRDTKEAHLPADVRPVLVIDRHAGVAFLANIRKVNAELS